MNRYICLATLIVGGIASDADAVFVEYMTRASFDTDYPTATRENWDMAPFVDHFPIANGSTHNGITYTYVILGLPTASVIVADQYLPSTPFFSLAQDNATPGDETDSDFFITGDTITFTFATPAIAFGIDISTEETVDNTFTATTDTLDVAMSWNDPFPSSSPPRGQFVGFSNTTSPFSSVTIASTSTSFGFTLDSLRVVSVPEPSAVLFGGLICGAVCMWSISRLVIQRVYPAAQSGVARS